MQTMKVIWKKKWNICKKNAGTKGFYVELPPQSIPLVLPFFSAQISTSCMSFFAFQVQTIHTETFNSDGALAAGALFGLCRRNRFYFMELGTVQKAK